MTLERAKDLMAIQVDLAGGYNQNTAKIILAEVQCSLGQSAVDQLIAK